MADSPNKRSFKNFLIDKQYQLYYPCTWIVMVALALTNFVVINMLLKVEGPMLAALPVLAKVSAALILLTSVWMGFSSIRHSHRIAGAMYNISRTLAKVLAGDYQACVKLRKEDYPTDVADQINELIGLLRSREAEATASEDAQAPEGDSEGLS